MTDPDPLLGSPAPLPDQPSPVRAEPVEVRQLYECFATLRQAQGERRCVQQQESERVIRSDEDLCRAF